jgi:site-specific DNA-methyltransferase (adenine-specific)
MELNKIYNMDCLDGMKLLPDNFIDLTVTSPPYDDLRTYKGYSFDFEGIAKELFRVTKDGGVVVWVVNDKTIKGSETLTSFKQALYFKDIGFNVHDTMIWKKTDPPPQTKEGKRYTSSFEYMFVLVKGKIKTFNPLHVPCKTAGKIATDNKGTQRKADGSQRQDRKDARIGKVTKETKPKQNVWETATGKSKFHPAVFPEILVEEHILSWSNENDIVMDTFMGSGTTAKMAKLNNRNFIGFEISPDYTNIAEQRIFS